MRKATIQNGIILQDNGSRITFVPVCPKCGQKGSSQQSNDPGGSRGYLCPKCQNRYETITKWVSF